MVRWPFKAEHSAFKAVVTRVALPYFRDSRYNVTRVTIFRTQFFNLSLSSWNCPINEYLAIDSGGNVSDLVVARIPA